MSGFWDSVLWSGGALFWLFGDGRFEGFIELVKAEYCPWWSHLAAAWWLFGASWFIPMQRLAALVVVAALCAIILYGSGEVARSARGQNKTNKEEQS